MQRQLFGQLSARRKTLTYETPAQQFLNNFTNLLLRPVKSALQRGVEQALLVTT